MSEPRHWQDAAGDSDALAAHRLDPPVAKLRHVVQINHQLSSDPVLNREANRAGIQEDAEDKQTAYSRHQTKAP